MLALSATYPESLAQHLTRYMREPTFVRLNPSDMGLRGETIFPPELWLNKMHFVKALLITIFVTVFYLVFSLQRNVVLVFPLKV